MVNRREEVQSEGLEVALKHERTGLGISMGVGKTLIGLKYLAHYNETGPVRALVVAPKVSIFESWKEDAVNFGYGHLLDCIDFSTYLSINKHDPGKYDIVILDECHALLDGHRLFLDLFKGNILGLTGTPPKRSDSEKGRMVALFCPIRYTYIVRDAVDEQVLNDYRVTVHMIELDDRKNVMVKLKTGGQFYTSELESYYYWTNRVEQAASKGAKQIASVMRMRTMMDFRSKEVYAKQLMDKIDQKCIVFANTHDQADRLCTHSYHSANPDSKQHLKLFQEGKISRMSTVLQLVEGTNIKGLREAIILHGYSGSSPKTMQRFGRLLRLNPDDVCHLNIIAYRNTVDVKWVRESMSHLDPAKVKYYYVKEDMYEAELFNPAA